MRPLLSIFALAFPFFVFGCADSEPAPTKQIAITIDDGPVARWWSEPSPAHRTRIVDSLITALDRWDAPATLFVIGRNAESPEAQALLARWKEAGVDLENHTYNHPNFAQISLDSIYQEIERTNDVLAAAGADDVDYLRVPFLIEGDLERKQALHDWLARNGMRNAYVTVNNQDWRYNADYAALEDSSKAGGEQVGRDYVQHMLESVAYWENVANELEGRPVNQVLLLHANRVNRDYLSVLLDSLDARGYGFITLDEAYEDPIYAEPDVYVSEGGESFLEHVRKSRALRGEPVSKSAGADIE